MVGKMRTFEDYPHMVGNDLLNNIFGKPKVRYTIAMRSGSLKVPKIRECLRVAEVEVGKVPNRANSAR